MFIYVYHKLHKYKVLSICLSHVNTCLYVARGQVQVAWKQRSSRPCLPGPMEEPAKGLVIVPHH